MIKGQHADMSPTCGFAAQIEEFVAWRRASGRWNEHMSAESMRYFDRHCAAADPQARRLTQEILDGWCEVRPTETASSAFMRTLAARQFAEWARSRGLTDAVAPRMECGGGTQRVPHHFTDDELSRFFSACDSIDPYMGRRESVLRALALPAFFRLLYSSGVRTTEARLLRADGVDLREGVLDIRDSKGRDQHYVALHPSMADVLSAYDRKVSPLQPAREYFFESPRGGPYGRDWVSGNFRALWAEANGSADDVVAYDLRHEYATRNIMSWDCGAFDAHDRLLWLSKSMGHRHISSTLYYFSIAPALADKIELLTGGEMDAILPQPWEVRDDAS